MTGSSIAMSNFNCERCGVECIDRPGISYISGCEHFPAGPPPVAAIPTIIAGGRTLFSTAHYQAVEAAIATCPWKPSLVISGGASGVDAMGERWAHLNKIEVRRFPADWDRYGRSAGPKRNRAMAEFAESNGKSGGLILVWDGRSRGSASMRKEALRAGLYIHEKIVSG